MSSTQTNLSLAGWVQKTQPLLILLFGVIYWGSYLRYWFNPHDEGGTAALTAMRLLEGQRPIRDVDLGYNVMWHYPIAALFSFTGVHYVAMRAYFFALSAISALCGWALVQKLTGRWWLALPTGLLLVVFPGSQFKNYIPLIGLLNTLWLVHTFSRQPTSLRRFLLDTAIGGAILGFSFLVRIDVAYFFALIWAGLLVIQLADTRYAAAKATRLVAGALTMAGMVLLTHLPIYLVAGAQGFQKEFVGQYRSSANMIRELAQDRLRGLFPGKKTPASQPKAASVSAESEVPVPAKAPKKVDRGVLGRTSWAQFNPAENPSKSALFVLTYAPFVGIAAFLGFILANGWQALRTHRFSTGEPWIQLLLVLGGALTIFPQFFFFRPDRPHLSEFMVGFLVTMTCGGWVLWQAGTRVGGWRRWFSVGLAVFLAFQACLYGWLALDHPSAGTIAARSKRKLFFKAENGVAVYLSRKESETLQSVYKAITTSSKPGEYVVCYPYQPGYNLMANRPTYERNVYIDNSTAPKDWGRSSVADIQSYKPAVIVIDDRAINGTEASKFSQWAPDTYAFVKANYHLVGKFALSEVYSLRPPKPTNPASSSL